MARSRGERVETVNDSIYLRVLIDTWKVKQNFADYTINQQMR
jgi:hypothetical protein